MKLLGVPYQVITITDTIQPRDDVGFRGGWWHRRCGAQKTDSDGNPNVFNVERNDDGKRWLNTNWVNPNDQWNLDNRLVFRLRKFPLPLPS